MSINKLGFDNNKEDELVEWLQFLISIDLFSDLKSPVLSITASINEYESLDICSICI